MLNKKLVVKDNQTLNTCLHTLPVSIATVSGWLKIQ